MSKINTELELICFTYDDDSKTVADEHELGTRNYLDKSVRLVLAKSSRKVTKDLNKDHTHHHVLW